MPDLIIDLSEPMSLAALADLAAANSRLAAEQNRVYELGLRILLESSLKNFENKLRLP